ncbi:uncharacterized protein BJX67DRAFT_219589 [Aspergillus lucknowensis]|uniref:Myb-like domain-containing protein n=1 Tax=Aspergillus lucknowensis TaxID=176173 RepID=A0ABR4M3V5_9EURO
MLSTFPVNRFKPWALPPRKPFPPHKTPNKCSPRSQKPPHRKPSYGFPSSTLTPPKHHLPARPPAEVCVHVSASTQPCTPSNCQIQTREVSLPDSEPNTFSEKPEYGAASPRDLGPHIPAPDPIPCCDPQDNAGIPTEPPAFRGDDAEDSLSPPSISSSDNDSLEEFFGLPDAQDDIPIDPVILANGSWENIDPQLPVPQAASLISAETTCQYPDPPAILHSPPNHYGDPSERDGGEDGGAQTSDHLPTHDRQRVHTSSPGTGPSCPNGAQVNDHVRGQPESAKRKTPQSDGRGRKGSKRHRVRSPSPPREDAFTTLRSHFMSLGVDDRLRFLSWLFENALPRCMSDSSPIVSEEREVQATRCLSSPHGIEQSPGVSREVRGRSRKGTAWSTEEKDLLWKLRKAENRPWSDTTRLFLEQHPGRSPGAIQVFWYTTLNKKGD